MVIAAVAVLLDLLFCCLVVAWLRHSARQRAECPHCLGHDTKSDPDHHGYCRDCERSFEVPIISMTEVA